MVLPTQIEHMNNGEVLKKTGTKIKPIVTIRSRQLTFLGYITRNVGLKNLALKEHRECKRGK